MSMRFGAMCAALIAVAGCSINSAMAGESTPPATPPEAAPAAPAEAPAAAPPAEMPAATPAADAPAAPATAEATAPAAPPPPDSKQLQTQAVERLTNLATYLEEEAAKVETAAKPILDKATSLAELEAAIDEAKTSGGAAAGQILSNPYIIPQDAGDADVDKIRAQQTESLKKRADEYREFSTELKELVASINAAPPEEALEKVAALPVPDYVKDILGPTASALPPPPGSDSVTKGLSDDEETRTADDVETNNPLEALVAGDERVAGSGASPSVDYPAVALLMSDSGNGSFTPSCTGTLIAPNVVLSAAHCFCKVHDRLHFKTSAKCTNGTWNRAGETVPALGTKWRRVYFQHKGLVEIENVEIEPSYDFPTGDLALVFLKTPIFDIEPVRINTQSRVPLGTLGHIIGFGRRSPADEEGMPLGPAAVTSVGNHGLKYLASVLTAECTGTHTTKPLVCFKYDKTRLTNRGGTTCDGDSGGPLITRFGTQYVLAGVTSGGRSASGTPSNVACGDGDYAFDVEVFEYRDWITRRLAESPPPAPAQPVNTVLAALSNLPTQWLFSKYHALFPKSVPSWKQQFYVHPNTLTLRLGVNSVPTSATDPIVVKLKAPDGSLKCEQSTSNTAVLCEVQNPEDGRWEFEVAGPSNQEFQIVATGFQ